MTLVELLVVMAILGVVLSASAPALHEPNAATAIDPVSAAARVARTDAVRSGRPVTRVVLAPDGAHAVSALPDGRVLVDSARSAPGGARLEREPAP